MRGASPSLYFSPSSPALFFGRAKKVLGTCAYSDYNAALESLGNHFKNHAVSS